LRNLVVKYSNMRIVIPVLALLFMCACGKDKFNTKPGLKFKDMNTRVLDKGQAVLFNLEVTDAEGDLTDSMFVYKVTRNCVASNNSSKYIMPEFPTNKNLQIEVEVGFAYRNNTLGYPAIKEPQCFNRNDTCFFRFVIRDKAGNASDTVNSPDFVIIRP
jgi:hypothetical protein